ncbi:ABC transporter ATP-binding protein [Roseomonas gilardii]|uniref:ABC transporter ATP-binding protein n=1 Tax=Roseomonas gilardii TaxID=257708 RepID=UPI00119D1E52|nr:ABC transporter ATP-binding protein [Roseomonas gilardii]
MNAIELRGLHIAYGGQPVVHGINLTVAPGEIVSLLGPSGCGKTTTLRAIGGFIWPESGQVLLHGKDVTDLPPAQRQIGFVFQGYALFPHLSVFDNVAYGLRARKVPRAQIADRVHRALSLVKLDGLAERKPRQLSGGQQQRVAIARALVIEPEVLLLDEPLSNLDAKLRHEMRVELRRMLKAAGIASIFVTHDQEEAIVLSDRIVLMNAGRIEQEGTPRAMYERPDTLFAAAFLGQANFLEGRAGAPDAEGRVSIEIGGATFRGLACGALQPGAPAVMVVKHERVGTGRPAEGGNAAECRFDAATFLGSSVQLHCDFAGQRLIGMVPAGAGAQAPLAPEAAIRLVWNEADSLVFPRA